MTEEKLNLLNALHVVGHWSVHDDGGGRIFYYDRKNNMSQWDVPGELAAHETDFMMRLMLQNAVARSNEWTAHDAGNGTLYYFNSKTRESKWERPGEWGAEETSVESISTGEEYYKVKSFKKAKEENLKPKNPEEPKETYKTDAKAKPLTTKEDEIAQEADLPLTEDDLRLEEERKERELKRMEQFRAMLLDKNIMPFCKWSVALPQIAGDPRFMGIPKMHERRAIFEHFVKHRREDLKAEKKIKLKQAKKMFAELLSEQLQLGSWEPSTPLSVFLSTLENNIDAERFKRIQDDALALLTLSAQEKIYGEAINNHHSIALKRDGEQLRLTKYLEENITSRDKLTMRWESDDVQKLIHEFYNAAASASASAALLSKEQQEQVFKGLFLRKPVLSGDKTDQERLSLQPNSPTLYRARSRERMDVPSVRRELHHSHNESREYRRLHSRSKSRSQPRWREYSRRNRSSRQRSASWSRSRSRSRKKRPSRNSFRHRHHSLSSSRSRSRSRICTVYKIHFLGAELGNEEKSTVRSTYFGSSATFMTAWTP